MQPYRTVTIPIGPALPWASLTARFPLTEGDWVLMMAILNAMRPGIVRDPPPAGRGADDDRARGRTDDDA